jgi:5-formaminoimidazole-4-carboxamide-1-beta-D-ribofuranosyl 5'-monophosphate synthetase
MSEIKMYNDVEVSVSGHDYLDAAPIIFDLKVRNKSHRNVSMDANSLYQNITVDDAKRIRKELKAAIKRAEGK